jgi:hypothetical protein
MNLMEQMSSIFTGAAEAITKAGIPSYLIMEGGK